MQRVGVVPMSGLPQWVDSVATTSIGAIVGTIIGILFQALRFEKRLKQFKVEAIDPIETKLLQMKQDSEAKLEKSITGLRIDMRELETGLQADMKELKAEVRGMFSTIDAKLDRLRG